MLFGLEFVASSAHPFIYAGFNSLCGYASINHVKEKLSSKKIISSIDLASSSWIVYERSFISSNYCNYFRSSLFIYDPLFRNVLPFIRTPIVICSIYSIHKRLSSKSNISMNFIPLLSRIFSMFTAHHWRVCLQTRLHSD